MKHNQHINQHIAAARNWLNRAEDSLEQEDDIQGDLKLMLAQAELQRAQEKNGAKPMVRWFKKLLPPAAACALALAGIIYAAGSGTGREAAVESSAYMTQADSGRQATPAEPNLPVPDNTVALPEQQRTAEIMPVPEQGMAAISNSLADDGQRESKPVPDSAAAAVESGEKAPAAAEAQLPSPEMQKLMQSAGSMLRK